MPTSPPVFQQRVTSSGRPPDGEELVDLIAAGAMTLEEILASGPGDAGGDPSPTGPLLERWSRLFAGGDRVALVRRLAWDGLDEETIAAALAQPPCPTPPAYLRQLPDILAQSPGPPEATAADSVPFAHLLMPWVAHSSSRLATLAPEAATLLAPPARRAAERHLLEQLSAVAAAALYEEFASFRGAQGVIRETPHGESDRLYRAFVESLRGPKLATWLARYPVLAKHWCLLSWQWSEGVAELVQRLAADLPALAEELANSRPLGPVTALEPGRSDRHDGGRQVALLRFGDGFEVVYKPRDVSLEAAWSRFCLWLCREGLRWAPPAPAVLARPGYGWVERVRCGEVPDGPDYARRAGALVFLAWLLGGADLHEDNIIGTADGPALVDAEVLLQPARSDLNAVATSILGTGLLTFPFVSSSGELVDAGGLVGVPRPSPPHRQWERVNRDAMQPVMRPSPPGEGANLPRVNGVPMRPTSWARELEEGFVEAHRFCQQRRDDLLAPGGPLECFKTAAPRVVFRPTESYVRMQRALFAPAYQRLGVERSIALDALNRMFAAVRERPRLWPLAAAERAALEQLDVPRFTLPATATTLVAPNGEPIPRVVKRSGWESLGKRLRALDDAQLAEQRRLLRSCALTQPLADERVGATAQEEAVARAAWRDELLAAATACAHKIEQALFHDTSKPDLHPRTDLNPRDLYHGLPGLALFFAALHLATGEPHWHGRALATWREMLPLAVEGEPALGACEGLGGRLYALGVLARWLGDEEAKAAAHDHVAALTPHAIAQDERLDVAGGAAGAVLGLLAAFQLLGDTRALEVARRCGQHLLDRQRADGGWAAADRAAPGFAHGAAGIACALARLAAVTGDARLQEAAVRGFLFEHSLYDGERRVWPVPARAPAGHTRHVYMHAWCNGAPGVALALATSDLPPARDSEGLEMALTATRAAGVPGLDHLCCGSLGIIDVLLTCGQRLGHESLVRGATARGVVVLRRAAGNGGFALPHEGKGDGVRLGLFHGLAGAGYLALRLASPGQLPSLIAFLPPGDGAP